MPGRIESYEPLLGAAVVIPIWRRKLMALLGKKDK